MDSFSFSNIKAEKANAIKKHRQLQRIASFFRVIEVCIVLAIISRFSIQLPVAVKNSGQYFKALSVVLISPRFIFILGNAIVITLVAKSGQFSGQNSTGNNSKTDLYEEFIEISEKSQGINQNRAENRGKQSNSVSSVPPKVIKATPPSLEIKNYQRSLSDNFKKPDSKKQIRELRRTVTEKCKNPGDGWVEISFPEDNMSNDEFKHTVEAFIARQKRFLIDEENSVF